MEGLVHGTINPAHLERNPMTLSVTLSTCAWATSAVLAERLPTQHEQLHASVRAATAFWQSAIYNMQSNTMLTCFDSCKPWP